MELDTKVVLFYCRDYCKVALDIMLASLRGQGFDNIVILSDVPICGNKTIPLENGADWWNKLEIFKHPELGMILYIDLDCLLVGDIKELCFRKRQSDWIVGRDANPEGGFTSWNAGIMRMYVPRLQHYCIWEKFKADEKKIRESYPHEQFWLQQFINPKVDFYPDGWITSYKRQGIRDGYTKIVHFHGEPKWWNCKK